MEVEMEVEMKVEMEVEMKGKEREQADLRGRTEVAPPGFLFVSFRPPFQLSFF